MHIFVDEAGVFSVVDHRKWSISCVGALVIPEADIVNIFKDFEELKYEWDFGTKEIKGRKLNEDEVASIVQLLSKYDVIFEVTAIDMASQTHNKITKHKLMQADKLTENLTVKHHSNLVKEVEQLQARLSVLSNPLYVQLVCTNELLYNILTKSTLYYSQRMPKELAAFSWFIDAKNEEITSYEKLWITILLPILQSMSFCEPCIQLIDADYSHFMQFCKQMDTPPEYLRDAVGDRKPFRFIDLKKIFKGQMYFEQSDKNLGLQLSDILTTSIRRAMNGNLQIRGWGEIFKLMVQSKKNHHTIHLIDFSNKERSKYEKKRPPYWTVMPLADRYCKQMSLRTE